MATALDTSQAPRPTSRPRAGWDANPVTRWLRANLFSSIASTIITLLLLGLLVKMIVSFVQWGIVDAVWTVPGNDTSACRAARGIGACWAVIPEKYRFILFGTYPYDQQWRPALATLLFIALFYVSCLRSFWRRELILIWAVMLSLIGLLMWGGVPGLEFVSQERWGGLPVTLVLATFGLAFGFPLGILVALGRRSKASRDPLALRALCRADPRCAADQPALHGERDVPAVHA